MTSDIQRRGLARQFNGVPERIPVGHQRGRGENTFAVGFDDALVHIARETEIIRVDYETNGILKQCQLDAQEFLRVGAHILDQLVHLARGAVQRIVELRIDEQLADSALTRIHLVDGRIDLLRDRLSWL